MGWGGDYMFQMSIAIFTVCLWVHIHAEGKVNIRCLQSLLTSFF